MSIENPKGLKIHCDYCDTDRAAFGFRIGMCQTCYAKFIALSNPDSMILTCKYCGESKKGGEFKVRRQGRCNDCYEADKGKRGSANTEYRRDDRERERVSPMTRFLRMKL